MLIWVITYLMLEWFIAYQMLIYVAVSITETHNNSFLINTMEQSVLLSGSNWSSCLQNTLIEQSILSSGILIIIEC